MYRGIRLLRLTQARILSRVNARACSGKPEPAASETTSASNPPPPPPPKEGISVNVSRSQTKYLLGGLAAASAVYYIVNLQKTNSALKMSDTDNGGHEHKAEHLQKAATTVTPPKKASPMHPELQSLLNDVRKARNFNPDRWINQKCKMFNEYMKKCGLKGAIVSLSGGVDSAVTLGLVKRASMMRGSPIQKVLAVSQPIHSSDWAYNRANECAKALNVKMVTVNQTPHYNTLKKYIDDVIGIDGGMFAGGQLRSYMRTPSMYYVAQLMSQSGYPTVVMGTGNKDEDGYLAYFCKAGDGVVDIQLIADLHKSEVFNVAKKLKVPMSIVSAKPSADLWDGQEDEEELGFTYDFIEFWVYYKDYSDEKKRKIRKALSKEALEQLDEWGKKAVAVHRANSHKFDSPVNINIM